MKPELDLRKVIMHQIEKLSTENFMKIIDVTNEKILSVDDKPLTTEELKSVIAFVRYLRSTD